MNFRRLPFLVTFTCTAESHAHIRNNFWNNNFDSLSLLRQMGLYFTVQLATRYTPYPIVGMVSRHPLVNPGIILASPSPKMILSVFDASREPIYRAAYSCIHQCQLYFQILHDNFRSEWFLYWPTIGQLRRSIITYSASKKYIQTDVYDRSEKHNVWGDQAKNMAEKRGFQNFVFARSCENIHMALLPKNEKITLKDTPSNKKCCK